MSAPYMPLFVADYLADTAHLTTAESGAYLLLIMNYWQRGKPLPADNRKLARIARMSDAEWADSRDTLAEFFTEFDDEWTHGRIERELEIVRVKSSKARASARASVEARTAPIERTLSERLPNAELLGKDRIGKKEDTASAASSLPAPPVQNLDLIETECRKAAGLEAHPSPGLMVIGPIAKLIDAGANLERDILPTLRAWAARKQRPPSNWRYFEGMIADAMRPADPAHFSRGQPPPSPVIADMVFLDRDNPAWHEAMQRVHEETGKNPRAIQTKAGLGLYITRQIADGLTREATGHDMAGKAGRTETKTSDGTPNAMRANGEG